MNCFKHFSDDREFEILERILQLDSEITVPIFEFDVNDGFYMEKYDELTDEQNLDPKIILQKIKLITRLHKIDVYHNNLSNNNFLIKNGVVKLVNFNSSFLMINNELLDVLYENIYRNDFVVIKSKYEAMNFELTGFIESF